MNKQSVIIDKNRFQAICEKKLCKLTQHYTVILPHVLLEECLTTEKGLPLSLLKKAEAVIKAGAFVSFSRGKILETEESTLSPLDSIIDEIVTEQIRNNCIEDLQIDFQNEAVECSKSIEPLVNFSRETGQKFWNTLSDKPYSKDWRQSDDDNNPNIRFKKWAGAFNEKMMRAYIDRLYPDTSLYIQDNWITWHLIRIILICGVEWAYKRNMSGESYEDFNITNDVYDIEYALCLACSDALFSQDKKLTILSKTIFPQKQYYTDYSELLVF